MGRIHSITRSPPSLGGYHSQDRRRGHLVDLSCQSWTVALRPNRRRAKPHRDSDPGNIPRVSASLTRPRRPNRIELAQDDVLVMFQKQECTEYAWTIAGQQLIIACHHNLVPDAPLATLLRRDFVLKPGKDAPLILFPPDSVLRQGCFDLCQFHRQFVIPARVITMELCSENSAEFSMPCCHEQVSGWGQCGAMPPQLDQRAGALVSRCYNSGGMGSHPDRNNAVTIITINIKYVYTVSIVICHEFSSSFSMRLARSVNSFAQPLSRLIS